MAVYCVTVFLSAFLLFQVQPLIGKVILPWFGGGPSVWTACMLFFQAFLLAGYALAHVLAAHLRLRVHACVHLVLLGASLYFLPIAPDAAAWKPETPDSPVRDILGLLAFNVGAPYLLLASTAPLLQRWFFLMHPGRSPYRLYALSNAGSLLALLSYPVLVEPLVPLGVQARWWAWGFKAFVLLCGVCALGVAAAAARVTGQDAALQPDAPACAADPPSDPPPGPAAPRAFTVLLWLLLSASGSVMLLATTNQLCQEVAVVPFLWVLPLSLYLLSFIICFDHARWYVRPVFGVLLAVCCVLAYGVLKRGVEASMTQQITIFSVTLFAAAMCCHGELARAKPHPRHLTLFYLVVATGGVLGGVFVALVAPSVFLGFWEYHMALWGCAVVTVAAWCRRTEWLHRTTAGFAVMPLTTFLVVFGWMLARDALGESEATIHTARNFYGVLRVNERRDGEDDPYAKRTLMHGRIMHGFQYIDAQKRLRPTSYYSPGSGIGLAMIHHPRRAALELSERRLRVGAIGLGTGTIAALGMPGDVIRFYEINPEVARVSEEFFSYREDSAARIDVVMGDARLCLERELVEGGPQRYDVIAVDAFSSDAIPIHLLTEECGRLYWAHLAPGGVLLVHISNRFLDLGPVTRGLAAALGCRAVLVDASGEEGIGGDASSWVILTDSEEFLSTSAVHAAMHAWEDEDLPVLLWTDDFAGLWQVLKM